MNQYEGMFLVKANLNEKETEDVYTQIKTAITKEEGKISATSLWAQNRRLSYPIKKNEFAHYYLVDFDLEPSGVDKIKKVYRLSENILRLLILKRR
ncbi:MAG: 30S ribosomal protein S6 [Candidatus Omnitrophica bacterium]|nr:30S ribosomal protein S6 [Candidatus Omnitrophota bacterium]